MSIIRALVIRDTIVNFTFSVLLRVMFSKDESLTHLLFENIKLFSVCKLYQGFKNLQSNIYSCTFYVGVSRWLSDKRIHVPVQETQEAWVWSLGWEDPLEEEMATHSSVLAWRIPWTQKPGGLYSPWGHRVRHDSARTHHAPSILRNKKWQMKLKFLPENSLPIPFPFLHSGGVYFSFAVSFL